MDHAILQWEYEDGYRDGLDAAKLHSIGCKCKRPLIGYRPDGRVRCRLCNVEEVDEDIT